MIAYHCLHCNEVRFVHVPCPCGAPKAATKKLRTIHMAKSDVVYRSIESGEAKEVYLPAINAHIKRFCYAYHHGKRTPDCAKMKCWWCLHSSLVMMKFDAVLIRFRYTDRVMLWEVDGPTLGEGNWAWNAPDREVFIFKLNKQLKIKE